MNKTNVVAFGLAAALILLSVGVVRAGRSANYAVDWQVFSSGGAPGAVGNVTLNGSLGQTAVGPSAGGDVSLSAGYWTGVGPVAPSPPADWFTFLPVVVRHR